MWTRSVSTRRSLATTAVRRFSDAGGRGRGGGRGGMDGRGRGRGGGGGRGRGGSFEQGGRGRSSFDRFRDSQGRGGGPPQGGGKFHRGGPRKENFAQKFLKPASEGRLVGKHNSGIPKLAARQGKSHRIHDPFPGQEKEEALDNSFRKGSGRHLESGYTRESGGDNMSNRAILAESLQLLDPGFIDDEDPYDDIDNNGFDADNHPDISKDEEGNIVLTYDQDDPDYEYKPGAESDAALEADGDEGNNRRPAEAPGGWQQNDRTIDPEEAFFDRDLFDFDADRPENYVPDEIANMLLPLKVEGPGLDDFLEATFEHPSKYAEARRYNYHSESLREPRPNFPKNRVQPTEDFITSHKRFLYVSGLPHFVDNERELGELENPIHCLEVSKIVAEMLGVKIASVSPASMTSAFVGYDDKNNFYQFFSEGPKFSTVDKPLKISMYTIEDGDESGFAPDEAIVKIEDVPAGVSIARLAHIIFPQDTDMGSIYGPLAVDDIKQLDSTTILVRMKSKEQAESALSSSIVQERMVNLGHYDIKFVRARRELHHKGYTGPNKGQAYKTRGKRLTVDTDTPSKEFFQGHAGVVQLRNMDLSTTKEEISKHFEPFCADRRDMAGSIEFATCSQNKRTDIVYVGFERFGEAEAVIAACSGLMNFGKGPVTVRFIKELFHPEVAAAIREARPSRPEKELLESLNNWESFVDPEEVKELEAKGIPKEVLADAFHAMRYHNQSYGSLDWGLQSEKVDPQMSNPGQRMRETMQLYIETLKEVLDGDEDIGISYEDIMTFPEDEQESGDISGAAVVAEDKERVDAVTEQRKGYFW